MAVLPPRPLPLAAWRENGEVTLGGRRVPVSRPRARTADGDREIELGTYAHFAARDPLADVISSGCWPACRHAVTRGPVSRSAPTSTTWRGRRRSRRYRASSCRGPERTCSI